MSQVLYRKYRSQDFSQIFGQESIKKILTEAIRQDKVAHAYLFTGPRGTGKTSMARILAKVLNCLDRKDINPCNRCRNCIAINESRFMDLIEIDAASNRGIDEIRELKEKVGFLPVEGAYKVYIIDEAHMLTNEAFNALLKTLEEPPSNVVFILATTEVYKLPVTVISRTQRFDFKLATEDELKRKLEYILKQEKIKYEDDVLEMIVNVAGGSFRDAESVLEKVLSSFGYKKDGVVNSIDVAKVLGLASSKYVDDFIEYTYRGNIKNAFQLIESVSKEGVDIGQYCKQLLLKARMILINNIEGVGEQYNPKFLFTFIKELLGVSEQLRTSLVDTIPLEIAVLSIVDVCGKEGMIVKESVVITTKDVVEEKRRKTNKSSQSKSLDDSVKKKKDITVDSEKMSIRDKVTSLSNLSFSNIKVTWGELVDRAKRVNPHLAAILTKVTLKEYKDDKLFVEVPFKFHKKQLESIKVNDTFQELVREVFSAPLLLDIEINAVSSKDLSVDEEVKDSSNAPMVEEIFGDIID